MLILIKGWTFGDVKRNQKYPAPVTRQISARLLKRN
jgi:hypothetical protein